jgi:hypothetical protein
MKNLKITCYLLAISSLVLHFLIAIYVLNLFFQFHPLKFIFIPTIDFYPLEFDFEFNCYIFFITICFI